MIAVLSWLIVIAACCFMVLDDDLLPFWLKVGLCGLSIFPGTQVAVFVGMLIRIAIQKGKS